MGERGGWRRRRGRRSNDLEERKVNRRHGEEEARVRGK